MRYSIPIARALLAAAAVLLVAPAPAPARPDVPLWVVRAGFARWAQRAAPAPEPSRPPTVTVAAVGDLLFDSAPGRLIAAQGPRAPFARVAGLLQGADVTVGNLECPLSRRGSPVPGKTYTFRGDPRAAEGLAWAGFDLVALGNNHTLDHGTTALLDTLAALRRHGIAFAGAGRDRRSAFAPAVISRAGARIAFLSFSEIGPASFAAQDARPGTAYTLDSAQVARAVRAAAQDADYVIVSFHWGVEKTYEPTARQVQHGRAAIDAGADLVLAHHPHRIQGVEFYRKGLIAYSLGNFVFSPGTEGGRDTMVLSLTLGPAGVTDVRARAVHIGEWGRPAPASGATATRIAEIITRTSRGRGTRAHARAGLVRLARR